MHSAGPELRDKLLGTALSGTGGLRYHLREVLGEGGQGWVYKANYDDPDGVWIVVKVLRPEGIESEAMSRFQREAEVLRMLGAVPAPNPNIVRFYDTGSYEVTYYGIEWQIPFIALEYVDGPTLSQVIGSHGGFGLGIDRARRIMKQVARALHTVHAHRIVHRDLKPSNILLAQSQGQELAKVTDFGLVKLPELGANRTATLAGASLGYAPPEQYEMGNNRVTVQTDVFSFAAILFEVLSGVEAFPFQQRDNPLRVVARMLSGERPSLARVAATIPRELRERPDLSERLDAEFARALAPDPAVRHESIRELWEKVEPVLREAGMSASGGYRVEDSVTSDHGTFSNPQVVTPVASVPTELADASLRGAIPVSCEPRHFRVIGQPMAGERLRAATIARDNKSIVALGARGLYHFANGVWSPMQLPAGLDARYVRGIGRLPNGDLLAFGDGGFVAGIAPSGALTPLAPPDADLTLLGADADERGALLVGERRSRPVGVLVEIIGFRGTSNVRTLEGTTRLFAVARVGGGRVIACGANGELVEVTPRDHREIAWGRTGHLYSIARASDGGAFAVGSGGHALRVAHPTTLPGVDIAPRATLEAVQTTRDLYRVFVDHAGTAWAVGAQTRLLRREHQVWTRLSLEGVGHGTLIAVSADAESVIALGEDGLVIEGR